MPGDRLLLVEDDRELAGLLMRFLGEQGYQVTLAADLAAGRRELAAGAYAVAVVDRGLPGGDGLRLLGVHGGAGTRTPVLVLTARGEVGDRVTGLEAGAADYLVKPFDLGELAARLVAVQRRQPQAAAPTTFAVGPLVIDIDSGTVRRDGEPLPDVTLTPGEVRLLAVLAARPRTAFTREDLRRRVFDGAGSTTVVDTYVHYCRGKLGRDVIRTVRGFGYRSGAG